MQRKLVSLTSCPNPLGERPGPHGALFMLDSALFTSLDKDAPAISVGAFLVFLCGLNLPPIPEDNLDAVHGERISMGRTGIDFDVINDFIYDAAPLLL
jgi:hypothetical protein